MLGDGIVMTGGTDTVGTGGGPVWELHAWRFDARGGALVTGAVRTGGVDITGAGWR